MLIHSSITDACVVCILLRQKHSWNMHEYLLWGELCEHISCFNVVLGRRNAWPLCVTHISYTVHHSSGFGATKKPVRHIPTFS